MIYLSVSLRNPWAKDDFRNLFSRSGLLSKHKAWEAEIIRMSDDLAHFSFGVSIRRDHAGVRLGIGLIGYRADFEVYDTRHWDTVNNCWEEYADSTLSG